MEMDQADRCQPECLQLAEEMLKFFQQNLGKIIEEEALQIAIKRSKFRSLTLT